MRKARKRAKTSRKCATQFETVKIPLCASECKFQNSRINKSISIWLSEQQKTLLKRKKTLKNWLGFPTQLVRKPTKTSRGHNRLQGIPPEELEFLTYFKSKKKPLEHKNLVGEPNISFKPLFVDDTNPSLAKYLRMVMDNSDLNEVYNINYYYQVEPESECQNRLSIQDLQAFLDPDEIAFIFDVLIRGGSLMQEQWDFLMNFLKAAAELPPQMLWKYFKVLQDAGLVTPHVVKVLRNLLKQMGLQLSFSQFSMLEKIFRQVENYQDQLILRELQRQKLVEEAERIVQEREGYLMKPVQKITPKPNVEFEPELQFVRKRLRSIHDDIIPTPYFEPWDADITWQDAQVLMRYSKRRRTAHNDLYDCFDQIGLKTFRTKDGKLRRCHQTISDEPTNYKSTPKREGIYLKQAPSSTSMRPKHGHISLRKTKSRDRFSQYENLNKTNSQISLRPKKKRRAHYEE